MLQVSARSEVLKHGTIISVGEARGLVSRQARPLHRSFTAIRKDADCGSRLLEGRSVCPCWAKSKPQGPKGLKEHRRSDAGEEGEQTCPWRGRVFDIVVRWRMFRLPTTKIHLNLNMLLMLNRGLGRARLGGESPVV